MRKAQHEDIHIQAAIDRAFYQGLIRGSVQKEVLLLAQSTGLLPRDLAPWLEERGDGGSSRTPLGDSERMQHLRLASGEGIDGHAEEERHPGAQPSVSRSSQGSAKSRASETPVDKKVKRRKLSRKARKNIAEAQKKRWAKAKRSHPNPNKGKRLAWWWKLSKEEQQAIIDKRVKGAAAAKKAAA